MGVREHTQTCSSSSTISLTCPAFGKSVLTLVKQFAVALISKLNCCNSLFHNIPEKEMAKLQVQNLLARILTNAPRFRRSVSILKQYIGFLSNLAFIFKYAL